MIINAQRLWVVFLILTLSGFCSLVYQTAWVKQLAIVVGIDVYSISLVVSGFFLGLSLGSYCSAKLVKKQISALRLYCVFEALVVVTALLLSYLLSIGAELYVWLDAWFSGLTLALFFLMIAVPAFFMGGTLIAMIKYCQEVVNVKEAKQLAARCYSANIAGAVIGTISASFFLMPWLGILHSLLFAVLINAIIVVLAFFVLPNQEPKKRSVNKEGAAAKLAVSLMAIYAASGFVALSFEIVWTQMIVQFMNTRSYAYSVILAVYLVGLYVGNMAMTKQAPTLKSHWQVLGWVTTLVAVFAVLSIALVDVNVVSWQSQVRVFALSISDLKSVAMLSSFIFIASFFILLPSICMGASFPLLMQIAEGKGFDVASTSGKLLAANTMAGVFGTLLMGFWVIPQWGVITAVKLLLVISVLCAAFCFMQSKKGRYQIAFPVVVMLLLLVFLPQQKMAHLLVEQKGGKLISFEEGIGNTVAVIEQGESPRDFRRLYIQGVSNTGDVMASKRYMRLQSYLPLMLHPDPKSALVIGLGTGITAGALTQYPGLAIRDVFELVPEVVNASQHFKGNYNVRENVNIVVGDGRHELLKSNQYYDLITLEPPPPTAAGVSNLYSVDFYRLCKKRLNDKGIVAQWWPIATQSVEASRSIVQSMLQEFKYVTVWTTEVHELLLVGSDSPQSLTLEKFSQWQRDEGLKQSLQEIGITSTEGLLATYIADRDTLEAFAGSAAIIDDNHPLLEYDVWTDRNVILEIMPSILAMQSPPAIESSVVTERILSEQEKLAVFYVASMAAYAGENEIWKNNLKWLYRADSGNRYFNWFRPDSF